MEKPLRKQGRGNAEDLYADTMEREQTARTFADLNREKGIFTDKFADGLNREKGIFNRTALFSTEKGEEL